MRIIALLCDGGVDLDRSGLESAQLAEHLHLVAEAPPPPPKCKTPFHTPRKTTITSTHTIHPSTQVPKSSKPQTQPIFSTHQTNAKHIIKEQST
ncbi:hypothetical protein M758_3G014400 [Ceratodon purpureus]|nr:hypothetical protein M758_3G014400 [Ceratodon purpureus]